MDIVNVVNKFSALVNPKQPEYSNVNEIKSLVKEVKESFPETDEKELYNTQLRFYVREFDQKSLELSSPTCSYASLIHHVEKAKNYFEIANGLGLKDEKRENVYNFLNEVTILDRGKHIFSGYEQLNRKKRKELKKLLDGYLDYSSTKKHRDWFPESRDIFYRSDSIPDVFRAKVILAD